MILCMVVLGGMGDPGIILGAFLLVTLPSLGISPTTACSASASRGVMMVFRPGPGTAKGSETIADFGLRMRIKKGIRDSDSFFLRALRLARESCRFLCSSFVSSVLISYALT